MLCCVARRHDDAKWIRQHSAGINVTGAHVQFSESIKLLGVQLDNALSTDNHVSAVVVHGCKYHIRALQHIRPRLDVNTAKMIARESLPLDSTIATV